MLENTTYIDNVVADIYNNKDINKNLCLKLINLCKKDIKNIVKQHKQINNFMYTIIYSNNIYTYNNIANLKTHSNINSYYRFIYKKILKDSNITDVININVECIFNNLYYKSSFINNIITISYYINNADIVNYIYKLIRKNISIKLDITEIKKQVNRLRLNIKIEKTKQDIHRDIECFLFSDNYNAIPERITLNNILHYYNIYNNYIQLKKDYNTNSNIIKNKSNILYYFLEKLFKLDTEKKYNKYIDSIYLNCIIKLKKIYTDYNVTVVTQSIAVDPITFFKLKREKKFKIKKDTLFYINNYKFYSKKDIQLYNIKYHIIQ